MQFQVNTNYGNDPSALLTGYTGAYGVFAEGSLVSEARAWGESFSVPENSILISTNLRITTSKNATGRFEVAVYQFSPSPLIVGEKLASAIYQASDYVGDLLNQPVRTFALSPERAMLSAGRTYLLTFAALDDFYGEIDSAAARDFYAGGSSYEGIPVPTPEPKSSSLIFIALVVGTILFARVGFVRST